MSCCLFLGCPIVVFPVSHGAIADTTFLKHFREHWYLAVYVVHDSYFVFAWMESMQPAGILHERPFPGHRQGKEQGIEPGVIESFSDVSSGRENKPLFLQRNGGEPGFDFTPFFRRPSSPQNDDMPDEALQSVMQLFEVFFAFRQQD